MSAWRTGRGVPARGRGTRRKRPPKPARAAKAPGRSVRSGGPSSYSSPSGYASGALPGSLVSAAAEDAGGAADASAPRSRPARNAGVSTTADHRRPRHQGRRHPRHQRQGRRRQRRHREKSRCPKPQWRRAQRLGRPNRESRSEAEPVRLRVGPSPGRSGMPRTTAKGSTPPGGPARAGPDAARRNSDADDRGRSTARRARPRRPRKGRPQSRRSRRNRGRSCVAMIPSPPRSGPTVRPRPPHAELG